MKKIDTIDTRRRAILKTFATSGISKALISSSPLVAGMLFSRHADAQTNGRPDKSVAIYIPGGAIYDFWEPSGSGESMRLGSMSAGLESVKTECNFFRNMRVTNGGHGQMPVVLSNSYSGNTYDVEMGQALGPDRAFQYVNLGVHSNGQGVLTRQGNSQVPFQDNPFNAFNLLFGDGSTMGGTNTQTNILNAHVESANAIRRKLAGYEVQRLDQHLDAISDTQRRLQELSNTGGGSGSCSAAPNSDEFPISFNTFSQQARLQADIIVAALACGLTSSASIAFGNHQKEFRIPELRYQDVYHQSIHGGGGSTYPNYVEMRAHLSSLTGYLIEGLRNQGILDSTVVVETTDMGNADAHSANDVPMMIAGGGDAINRGRTTVGRGFNQYDMLTTAASACGVDVPYGQVIPGVLT